MTHSGADGKTVHSRLATQRYEAWFGRSRDGRGVVEVTTGSKPFHRKQYEVQNRVGVPIT